MTGMVRAADFLWKRRLAVPTGIIRSKGIPVTEPNWLTGYGPNMSTNWAHSVGTTGGYWYTGSVSATYKTWYKLTKPFYKDLT